MFVLNYLYFIIITYFGAKYLFGGKFVTMHPYNKDYNLLLDGPEMFWVLTFSTGLFAFSAPAGLDLMALRLLVLEIFCFIGLFLAKSKPCWTLASTLYLAYIVWLFIGLAYSPAPDYGVRVILKYLYGLIIMLFSSAIVRDEELFLKASLGARLVAFCSLILVVLPILDPLFVGVFWCATARAINYTVMFVFSLALFFHGGKKKINLLIGCIFVIPCIVWVFRTSIMGTTLALMLFCFFKYKLKSLPFIFGVFVLFILSIFFIPSVRDKMFSPAGEGKSVEDLRSGNISADDINSNGRFAMWEWALDHFYKNKELTGSGTGNLQETFYALRHPFGTIKIIHNDYVQMLSDNGLIGIVLFLGTFLCVIIHSFFVYQKKDYPWSIRICAITAGSSIAGVLLTMYTDNGINYSMATISYPCGFYGMMIGMIKGYKNKSITNVI